MFFTQKEIAVEVNDYLIKHEHEIRSIGFYGCGMSRNTYMWQMMCMVLNKAITVKFKSSFEVLMPKTAFGEKAYVWGEENPESLFGICELHGKEGDIIQFMDWMPVPKGDHHDFYGNSRYVNIFIDIAKGNTGNFSEYDMEAVAFMVKKGYVIKKDGKLEVTVPVYTEDEFGKVYNVLEPIINAVYEKANSILEIIRKILLEHTPVHLKKQVHDIAVMRLLKDTISVPARIMHQCDYIKTTWDVSEMPTMYIRLIR